MSAPPQPAHLARQATVEGRRTVRELQRQFDAELEGLRLAKHRVEALQLEVDAVQLPMSEASGEAHVVSTETGDLHVTREGVRSDKSRLTSLIEATLQNLDAAVVAGGGGREWGGRAAMLRGVRILGAEAEAEEAAAKKQPSTRMQITRSSLAQYPAVLYM